MIGFFPRFCSFYSNLIIKINAYFLDMKSYISQVLLLIMLTISSKAYSEGRILMIDPVIDSVSNVNLTFHRPQKSINNPVLKADKKWELNDNGDPYAAPFSGGIWYDEVDSIFKMWYSAGGGKKHGLITCYAESENGEDWRKPNLDIIPGTNIVDTLEHDCVTVLLDKHEKDPSKRYKMFCVKFDTPSAVSMALKYSSDGKHWGKIVSLSGDLYDRCSAYYDAFRQKYVLSLKTKDTNNLRARNFIEHTDPEMVVSLAHRVYGNENDKFIKFWFSADKDDPRHPLHPEIAPAIYNHDAIPYESLLLGQFVIWQGPENKDCIKLNVQKRNEILLGFSYDGFNWLRPDKMPFIPVCEDNNAWDAGNIQSTMGSPIIVGDSLYFYYSGRYNSRPKHPSNFATGLAKLRRDGFISISQKNENDESFLITKPMYLNKRYLFLNADASKGDIIISIYKEKEDSPIAEYHLSHIDSTKIKVADIGQIINDKSGQYRLKIFLQKSSLYSFWISDSEEGNSGGYTGGGGAKLHHTGRDI